MGNKLVIFVKADQHTKHLEFHFETKDPLAMVILVNGEDATYL